MKVTKNDWLRIHDIMRRYGRRDGYVDEVDGRLQFFDSDPCHNGVHACHVTIEDVFKFANSV